MSASLVLDFLDPELCPNILWQQKTGLVEKYVQTCDDWLTLSNFVCRPTFFPFPRNNLSDSLLSDSLGACITFFLDPLLPVPFMALEPVPKVKADINELHHHWLPITWVRPTASYIPKAAAFLLRNISCHEASESVRFFKNSNSQEVDSL